MSRLIYPQVISAPLEQALKSVSLLICDIDGVFSDGRVYMGNNGEELKAFHTRDGYGIKMLQQAGIDIAVITGRNSNIVQRRMQSLGVQHIYQGQSDKLKAFNDLLSQTGLSAEQCSYIGDDLIDAPVMQQVAVSFAVADAHPLLRQQADIVTELPGGYGAVRECCDIILNARGVLHDFRGLSI